MKYCIQALLLFTAALIVPLAAYQSRSFASVSTIVRPKRGWVEREIPVSLNSDPREHQFGVQDPGSDEAIHGLETISARFQRSPAMIEQKCRKIRQLRRAPSVTSGLNDETNMAASPGKIYVGAHTAVAALRSPNEIDHEDQEYTRVQTRLFPHIEF